MSQVLSLLKRSLPRAWKRRLKIAMGFHDMGTRLANLRRAGFSCTGAVDVGAYVGDWGGMAHSVWGCPVLAVEPNPEPLPALRRAAASMPMIIEPVALSDSAGQLRFHLDDTNSRLASPSGEAEPAGPSMEVQVVRLDELLDRHPAFQPNLLKADVQGFELQVLRGAGTQLHRFEVIVLEVSIIRIGPVPVFQEVVAFMDERGYRLYDFLPMYYRPLDGALWQGDAFFVRNDSPLVASLAWR